MSNLLTQNTLSNILKPGENVLVSSSILNQRNYNKIGLTELSKHIDDAVLTDEDAATYLMYFIHHGFNGNHRLLGFAFLKYYLDQIHVDWKNTNDIYKKYFMKSDSVKKILKYYIDVFYEEFYEQFKTACNSSQPPSVLREIKNIKTNKFPKNYFQVLPFQLMMYIWEQEKLLINGIFKKITDDLENDAFKKFSQELYKLYNSNSPTGYQYLNDNINFQIFIVNGSFKKINRRVSKELWFWKFEEGEYISRSAHAIEESKLNSFIQFLGKIRIKLDFLRIDDIKLLLAYTKFIKKKDKNQCNSFLEQNPRNFDKTEIENYLIDMEIQRIIDKNKNSVIFKIPDRSTEVKNSFNKQVGEIIKNPSRIKKNVYEFVFGGLRIKFKQVSNKNYDIFINTSKKYSVNKLEQSIMLYSYDGERKKFFEEISLGNNTGIYNNKLSFLEIFLILLIKEFYEII